MNVNRWCLVDDWFGEFTALSNVCIYLCIYGMSIIYELQIYQRVKEMLVLKAAQMKVPLKK
jgi:hypothetical protein